MSASNIYFTSNDNIVEFNSNQAWTVPDGVRRVLIIGCGGGEGGGTSSSNPGGAGAGMGQQIVPVVPGEIVNITIGNGGAGVASGFPNIGGNSSFSPVTTTSSLRNFRGASTAFPTPNQTISGQSSVSFSSGLGSGLDSGGGAGPFGNGGNTVASGTAGSAPANGGGGGGYSVGGGTGGNGGSGKIIVMW